MEDRRRFFQKSGQLAAGALAVGALAASTSEAQAPAQTPSKKLKIMMRSGWGTDDPTRGSFVFAHALAFADAGHDVQIFLTGEATYLMRKATVDAVKPIGWPPLSEMMEKIVAKHIPVFS
jgi:TRAP-type mannitol/chloroaromatic compound transport system substrate-binding protein